MRLPVAPLPLRERDVDGPVRLPRSPHDALGLNPGARERLLAEDVPPPFEGGDGNRFVQMIRCPDAYDVQIVAGDEVLPIAVQVLDPVLPAELL